MDELEKFKIEVSDRIKVIGDRADLKKIAYDFQHETGKFGYLYNFEWFGLPIIQYPQDILALQEIIYKVKPDLILEAGVARGGSLIFSASMLALLDMIDQRVGVEKRNRQVIGIDIDIRPHNRQNIEGHPLSSYIGLIQGSSIDPETIAKVKVAAKGFNNVMVLLDSNHTHDHVLAELHAYSELVAKGSYLIVYDTVVEHSPPGYYEGKPWGRGNSPLTAVRKFLSESDDFEIDALVPNKFLITVAPDGFLRRVK
jgi:cephalosporin hydroxylase